MKREIKEGISWTILLVATICNLLILKERNAAVEPQILDMEVEEEPHRAQLLFVGDWMQHTPQITAARRGEGFDYSRSIEAVAPLMREADLTVVNLETTLRRREPYTGYPMFRAPAALADALHTCGVDVALLANNHCCDGGREGIITTAVELAKRNITHTGAYYNEADRQRNQILRLEVGGIRIALINYTYGTNGLPTPQGMWVNRIDTLEIARDLTRIEAQGADCVVACLHWGNEYERRPNHEQQELATFLQQRGVDLIIGSHPHVIQPIEADSSRVVAWSLGNFVSNQQQRYRNGGLMLRVEIEKREESPCRYRCEAVPLWVLREGYRILPPEVADTLPMTESARQLYAEFIRDSRTLLQERPYK